MKGFEWYPVFFREMLLFKKRFFRLSYLLSAMMVPLMYLIVFGLGLGRDVRLSSSSNYLNFLIPGLVAMSSMVNSYSWIANSINLGRLHFRTFQVLLQAPIPLFHVVLGEVLSAMIKGLFAGILVLIAGLLTPSGLSLKAPFWVAFVTNCFLFASLGFVVGMLSKGHEETATYSNFLIFPMAFFCGTFFPLERIPWFLRPFVYIMPLTHTNLLMRKSAFDTAALLSLTVLVCYSVLLFLFALKLINDYDE